MMHQPISRRAALKASGVAIFLPMLESMGRAAGGKEIATPKRMVLICNTLGLYPPALFPKNTGQEYEPTEYLKLLEEHRNQFTLYSGLSHPDQHGKQPHDSEMTWLTSARNPGMGGFRNSISVDQLAATKLERTTRFRSIALSTNTQKSQSYTSNGVMLPAEQKPSRVFEKLFLTGGEKEIRKKRQNLADGKSILDFVGEQSQSLKRRVSGSDQRQLEEFFSAIRRAETELQESEEWLDQPKPKAPLKKPNDIFDKRDLIGRTESLFKLIPLILQTDSSRFVTMVIQDHNVVPRIEGVKAEHHNLSHHGLDKDKIKQLKIIEKELVSTFSRLLSRLSTPNADKQSLLESTSVLFGSNLGNANAHDPSNLPIILAGGGHKNHGTYVAYNKSNNKPLCNLFVSLLNHVGVETDTFGTSSGRLEI